VSEIRKLISRWHRDELGAERKAARRKCSKALAPILDIIRKNAVHAFSEGGGRFTGMPRDAAPSLSHLEASRALLGLVAAARGARSAFSARSRGGEFTAKNNQSRYHENNY
jgi:hypothetical protein